MTYFLKKGNTFSVTPNSAIDITEDLPVGNYTVKMDQFKNFYLEEIESFKVTNKLYGNCSSRAERILNTFESRPATTGVMLTGEKGSGKTLLTKMISILGAEKGYPSIVINQAWCGDQFNTFIQQIEQPCIIVFDEFEKVYDRDSQEAVLTLLDGVFPTKKLFILTCNDKWKVDSHMRNRPGRIYYMIDYKGLEIDFIREYCNDNLFNKEHIDTICKISTLFDQFNFDMLKALVEEMNRYNESPQESLAMLNAKPELSSDKTKFNVDLQVNGLDIEKDYLGNETYLGNPLSTIISLSYRYDYVNDDGDEDYDWKDVEFKPSNLHHVDTEEQKFIFINENNDRLVLTKIREKSFNYFHAF